MQLEAENANLRELVLRYGPTTELQLLGDVAKAVNRLETNLEMVRKAVIQLGQRVSALPCPECLDRTGTGGQ